MHFRNIVMNLSVLTSSFWYAFLDHSTVVVINMTLGVQSGLIFFSSSNYSNGFLYIVENKDIGIYNIKNVILFLSVRICTNHSFLCNITS